VDWGQPNLRGPYPRLIVTVSPQMRRNYQLYGDLVSFDLTYNLIKNLTIDGRRYGLGVFCLTDTNIRLLIGGYSLMCD
jgi:hypothetical protein